MANIEKLTQGSPVNKVWETVNKLIDIVNALQSMTVSPTGSGKLIVSDGNAVLQLETTNDCPTS